MQFMLMCTFEETRWNALPAVERDRIMQAYKAWVDAQVADGTYLAGGKLDESPTASTVTQRDGKAAVLDGPFAETREQIGGFHVLECADRDAAILLAQQIPTLPAGGRVEVRPMLHVLG